MARSKAAKITISLPDYLVDYATAKAARLGVSRSQVIAAALAEQQTRERAELAGEGYRFYAEEAREFAEAGLPATASPGPSTLSKSPAYSIVAGTAIWRALRSRLASRRSGRV